MLSVQGSRFGPFVCECTSLEISEVGDVREVANHDHIEVSGRVEWLSPLQVDCLNPLARVHFEDVNVGLTVYQQMTIVHG